MSITAALFDLVALRGAFGEEFAAWDAATQEGNTGEAKRARRAILQAARQGLLKHPATLGGFYLFVDLTKDGLSGLNYIGIADAPQRPIGGRIVDRLRDDSALDVTFDELTDDEARPIIRRRLVCALPRTGQNYVEKHLKVGNLFRRSPTVIVLGCDKCRELIREAEKILIASAAAAGAPLTNEKHMRFRGPSSQAAFALANLVIDEAVRCGFPTGGATRWRGGLTAVVTRSV